MDIIQESYVWARVVNPKWLQTLREKLGYNKIYWTKTIWGMKKEKEWVSCITRSGWFLAGLIPEIKKRWPQAQIEEIHYKPKTKPPEVTIDLRNYQIEAIQKALKSRIGIIQAPTGSGKTVMGAALISGLQKAKCLFIVHTKPLLQQTSKELSELLQSNVGRIGGGDKIIENVTVATIQTLNRLNKKELKQLEKLFNLLIVDEAHHAHAFTYRKVLATLEIPLRIGLTATPHKLWTKEEYMLTTGVLGPIITQMKYKELAEEGYLSWPRVLIYPCKTIVDGNWHEVYKQGIVHNQERNELVAKIARELPGTVLIRVTQTAHGRNIHKLLPEAELVTGDTERDVQEKIKQSLKNKKTKIVIATTVWKEGVDVPSLDAVINAAGGKSEISTIQTVGRALRPKENLQATIVDFLDIGNEYLEEHSDSRIEIYKAFDWDVEVVKED